MKYELQKDFAMFKKLEILIPDADWIWYSRADWYKEHIDIIRALPKVYKPIKGEPIGSDRVDKVVVMLCEERDWSIDREWSDDIREAIVRFMPKMSITKKQVEDTAKEGGCTLESLINYLDSMWVFSKD